MSDQEIKDMREDLKYFTSNELKKEEPELYQDKSFRDYCKTLLNLNDEEFSSEETQTEFYKRYEAASRKAYVVSISKCKDNKLKKYANEILLNSGGNITEQQYEELQKKVALLLNEKARKKDEAAYKRLKTKEATGEITEREEEKLDELAGEVSEDFLKKVEEEINNMFL